MVIITKVVIFLQMCHRCKNGDTDYVFISFAAGISGLGEDGL